MIKIYTDGGCSQINHSGRGPGGWAAILVSGDDMLEITGGEPNTTNNRMEMIAVLEGLCRLGHAPTEATVYSDSAYIVNCLNAGWYKKWRKNGWKASGGKPVENQDLWNSILQLAEFHSARFVKVKGHSDDALNNRCDELAVAEVAKQKLKPKPIPA